MKEQIKKLSDFSNLDFWDKKYKTSTDTFEWYQNYNSIKSLIEDYFKDKSNVLHIGCGSSKFAEDLLNDNDEVEILNIDFSEKIINAMNDKYKLNNVDTRMKFLTMNVYSLDSLDDKFDVVFDKGLLDSLLCEKKALNKIQRFFQYVYDVLNSNGVYIIVSNSMPDFRTSLFSKNLWNYSIKKVEKKNKNFLIDENAFDQPENFHYIYILNKICATQGDDKPNLNNDNNQNIDNNQNMDNNIN